MGLHLKKEVPVGEQQPFGISFLLKDKWTERDLFTLWLPPVQQTFPSRHPGSRRGVKVSNWKLTSRSCWFQCCELLCRFVTLGSLKSLTKRGGGVYAVPMSNFLPDLICSVQIGAASIKNSFGGYSPWSRAEIYFWDASETCCSWSGGIRHCLERPRSAQWPYDSTQWNQAFSQVNNRVVITCTYIHNEEV